MKYFDLHCDTMTECWKRKQGLLDNNLNVSVKGAAAFQKWVQVFAVWMPDSVRGADAWRRFQEVCSVFKYETGLNGIRACCGKEEIENAVDSAGENAAILSIEGSAALGGDIENLITAFNLGVRIITLTWNGKCEAGGGCLDGTGLTPFGFELVGRMKDLGMIIDVSHLSDCGFFDVANSTDAPFIASHSNARAVCPNARNLTETQFNEIKRRGGIVGLNLYPAFLGGRSLDSVLKHVDYFLSLGGEDTLAVGADFDGAQMPDGISGIADMEKLYEMLLCYYGKFVADKVFFDNAYKFFKTVLTGSDSCNNIIGDNSSGAL